MKISRFNSTDLNPTDFTSSDSDSSNFTTLEEKPQGRSLAEWVSFGTASVILAGVLGVAGFLWIGKSDNQPPDIQIYVNGPIRQSKGQYYVPFRVTNTGGTTAEAVKIIGELSVGEGFTETGEQSIDFLSRQEKEDGEFVFTRDPRQGNLSFRVGGYKLP